MSDRSLVDVAWQIDELICDDRVRIRFLAQCWEYLRLTQEKGWPNPLPFVGDPDQVHEIPDEVRGIKNRRPLELCAQYAVLAAIHEAHLHPSRPIVDPAPWPDGAAVWVLPTWESPMVQNNVTWAWVVLGARDLVPTDHQLRNLDACLAAVRKDLTEWLVKEFVGLPGNEAGARSTRHVTMMPTPPPADAGVPFPLSDVDAVTRTPQGVLPAAHNDEGQQFRLQPVGPEAPHFLRWNGQRLKIGKGRSKLSWLLLRFFWQRDSANYEDLQGHDKPWLDPVNDSTVVTAVTRFNNDMPDRFPWRLRTKNRTVYKESRENLAK